MLKSWESLGKFPGKYDQRKIILSIQPILIGNIYAFILIDSFVYWPASNNRPTTSARPEEDAQISGVSPSWSWKSTWAPSHGWQATIKTTISSPSSSLSLENKSMDSWYYMRIKLFEQKFFDYQNQVEAWSDPHVPHQQLSAREYHQHHLWNQDLLLVSIVSTNKKSKQVNTTRAICLVQSSIGNNGR